MNIQELTSSGKEIASWLLRMLTEVFGWSLQLRHQSLRRDRETAG
jgi:hypothetical protein